VSRLLGIDHGTRRIGVAVADTETGIAFERPALRAGARLADAHAVADLVRREGASLVVLGLPLEASGAEGAQARRVRAFGQALTDLGIEVAYDDERFTSAEAARLLVEADRTPTRASGELDSAAARLVLQQFLDHRAVGPRAPLES
jgi:putative Holliday junction resolvase